MVRIISRISASRAIYEDKGVTRLRQVTRDITESRQAGERVRDSEEQLRRAFG